MSIYKTPDEIAEEDAARPTNRVEWALVLALTAVIGIAILKLLGFL